MAQRLIRVIGITLVLALLLAIATLVIPAQAGEVAPASIDSNEQLGESGLFCLVIGFGAALLAVWVWAEHIWKFIHPR